MKTGNKKLMLVSANRHKEPYPVYPLAISYLNSYLSANMPGIETCIFDFMTGSIENYIQYLVSVKPDYVGISLRNIDDVNIYKQESFISHYKDIIISTRENSNATIIIGGAGFSIYPELLFKTLNPDFGIFGEGEISLKNLLEALSKNDDFKNIEGLLYLENNELVINERVTFNNKPLLSFDDPLTDFYWQTSGMLNIQTKRGCPYRCIYCTYPLIEGSKVRTLNPDQIIKTLSEMYFKKGIDYVFFTDSIFNISNDFNRELADRLIAADFKIKWGGYFNFANLDFQLLEKLKLAGLSHIEFGTESLSDTILKKYGKPFTVSDIFRVSEFCEKLEIENAHFLILGGYGETEATLDETFGNSKKIGKTVFFPFIGMRIYPGTVLHKIAIMENIVKEDDPLLRPEYYVSKDIDLATLKEKAKASGRRWVFPDENLSDAMIKMRNKNKKGPLWDYLTSY